MEGVAISFLGLAGTAQVLNGIVCFGTSLAFAALCALIAPTPGLKKWCWTLPALKVVGSLLAGIPSDAYIVSPFASQHWDLGTFRLGLGFQEPLVLLVLSGELGARRGGEWFALGAGDVAANALAAGGFGWLMLALVALVLAVGTLRTGRRLWLWARFWCEEQRWRRRSRMLERRRVYGRWVRVMLHVDEARGTYTTGIFCPVIWLSRRLAAGPPDQLRAAIEHELAHVRHFDLVLFDLLRLIRDAFWFLPGLGLLERQVRTHAELSADSAAMLQGCSALALAQAIAAEADLRGTDARAALGGRGWAQRISCLFDPPRSLPWWRAGRMLLATYLSACLLQSNFLGY